MVKALLKSGAGSGQVKEQNGPVEVVKVLLGAALNGQVEVVKALLWAGAVSLLKIGSVALLPCARRTGKEHILSASRGRVGP